MTPTTAEIHELMQKMQTEKIISSDGKGSFIVSSLFVPIFTQYIQREQSPKSLIQALMSYCPTATGTELSLYCGVLMEIIKINVPSLYHEIYVTLDRDWPTQEYMKHKSMTDMFNDIKSEKSTEPSS